MELADEPADERPPRPAFLGERFLPPPYSSTGSDRRGYVLITHQVDVYQTAPDKSWLPGLGQHAAGRLRAVDKAMFWPEAVQQVTGRALAVRLADRHDPAD